MNPVFGSSWSSESGLRELIDQKSPAMPSLYFCFGRFVCFVGWGGFGELWVLGVLGVWGFACFVGFRGLGVWGFACFVGFRRFGDLAIFAGLMLYFSVFLCIKRDIWPKPAIKSI